MQSWRRCRRRTHGPQISDMTAKTSTERSRERRERLKAGAVSEVRGIHAPPDDHPTIRAAAKRLADRLAKRRKPTNPTKG